MQAASLSEPCLCNRTQADPHPVPQKGHCSHLQASFSPLLQFPKLKPSRKLSVSCSCLASAHHQERGCDKELCSLIDNSAEEQVLQSQISSKGAAGRWGGLRVGLTFKSPSNSPRSSGKLAFGVPDITGRGRSREWFGFTGGKW